MSVKISLRRARLLPVALLAPGLLASVRLADPAPAPAPVSGVAAPAVPADELPALITALADKEARAAAYAKLVANPSRAELVALLENPSLALRVGALEVLEDIGGSSAFDPWLAPGDSTNAAALALWKNWAVAPDSGTGGKGGALTDDRRLSYLRDILGDKPDKARRAAAMLARDGAASVGFLENHLRENLALTAGLRGRIRETQYAIVLAGTLGDNAASVANRLVFGNRDAMLAAMENLRSAGAVATPVLRDFLTHPDPLVRESACDIILVCGRAEAFPLVEEALREETDPNVIQGALRPLKDIRTKAVAAFIARHISGNDEELALAALRVASSQSEGERAADAAAVIALGSPSWRVRAGALEYVALRTPAGAKDAVMKLLDDKDDFVVYAAIKAATALRLDAALPKLREMFLKNPALAGPVFAAYASGGSSSPFGGESSGKGSSRAIDEAMLAKLAEASADDRIAVIRAASGAKALLPTVRRLAGDKDSDVACAALRALASDSDRVKEPDTVVALVSALRSGVGEKRLAVLAGLRLPIDYRALVPQSADADDAAGSAEDSGETAAPTALDGMFSAFAGPAGKPAETPVAAENSGALFDAFGAAETPGVAPGTTGENTRAALLRELVALTDPATDRRLRELALGVLAGIGHPAALAALEQDYDSLDTARRAALADGLPATMKASAPLFRRLLADPVDEVRRDAASSALDSSAALAVAGLPFAELSRAGSPLKAHEVYGYRFEYALTENFAGASFIRKWADATLASPDAPVGARVLACIALRDRAAAAPVLEKAAISSDSAWVRRAAGLSLLNAKPREISRLAPVIAGDASPFVREVLPGALLGGQGGWTHRFDDLNQQPDQRWNSEAPAPRITPEAELELRQLAASDPVPSVRFAAQFALMAQGRAFDADELVRLIASGPEQEKRVERVTSWLGSNIARVTPAMRPVIAVARLDSLDRDSRAALLSKLGGKGKAGVPLTFAAYSGASAPAAVATESAEAGETPAKPAVSADFVAVFFHKPGCRECARTREFLDMLRRDFPGMKVEEHDILTTDGVLLNQTVCTRLDIPAAKHGLAPAVFTRAGGVVLGDITPGSLAKLFARALELPGDDAWRLAGDAAKADAAKEVGRRYDSLTLGVVVLAGLIDGINPCAFATIIFFLSYLRITRRSSREMLLTGTAFIAGVFIAYFAAGLALHGLLAELHRFAWLQRGMNLTFGVLALVAAGLSLLDGVRARRGELAEMTLKLPAFLGDRIRKTIREGAKARAFVAAAFVTGVIVSFIELACTGQVYAPIVYKIGAGNTGAAGMLLVYNLAFVLPLVALFIATWFGLKNGALLAFQKRHTSTVKFALAGLFLILAGVIFFGV